VHSRNPTGAPTSGSAREDAPVRAPDGCANVNATVDERDSDMGGGAVFHDNRVEIEATSSSRPGGASCPQR
jgi:hypothetical protein